MKKKVFNIWLLAALVCGLSLSVTSCKDDDKEMSSEEQEQKAIEQAEEENTVYSVLDNLANLSDAPADFLSGSYLPSIGVADDGDEGTRIVNTNDMETAAKRFADLVGAEITEDTQTYTWSNDAVGTMTYTKSSDGRSWATVDVNIKQIHGLNKIIYRSPEQADNNGKFDGTAYYRFGDVVKKENADGNEEFWICVRPCFGPEGKEDSHWVTVSSLPQANIFAYHSETNDIDYALPTKIGDNHEHSQNFAEMLFAIFFPEEWENNIINNPKTGIFSKGIPMFNDFDKANLKYHRQFFWQRVRKAWTDPKALTNANGNNAGITLLSSLFGQDGTEEYFMNMLKSADGLNLLTNGYSWWTKTSNYPTLYRYRFVNGEGKESNMHMEPIKHNALKNYHSVSAEVIKAKIQLNCIKDYSKVTPGWVMSNFFGSENKHYIIRHATGADLSSDGKEKPKEALKGVEEVYRYNKYYNITDLNVEPEILYSTDTHEEESDIDDDGTAVSQENIKVGYYFAADGNIYKTKKTCDKYGGAQAVVVYLGGEYRVEDDQSYNGLAMSLLKTETYWDKEGSSSMCDNNMFWYANVEDALKAFNGMAYTRFMKECTKEGHNHEKIRDDLSVFEDIKTSNNGIVKSSWFVPSLGQFLLAIEGLGGKYDEKGFQLPEKEDPYLVDLKNLLSEDDFMTSTFDDECDLYRFQVGSKTATFQTESYRMLIPFIAFKYNNGAGRNHQ